MLLVVAMVSLLQVEKKADLEKTKLFVYDSEKGVTLRVRDDGKVELTLREDKGEKTYSAESTEEFSTKYPDVVKRNGLRKYLRSTDGGLAQNDFEQWWGELRKNRRLIPELPDFGAAPLDEDWNRFFQDPRKLLEEFRRRVMESPNDEDPAPAPAPAPGAPRPSRGKEFGIKFDSVGETLRDQLSLKEGEGVLVGEVKPDSVAEKAGVRQYDIILKLDGKPVGDQWEFRKDVLRALEKSEFEVDILRGGKRESLKAKPAGK